MSDEGRKRCDGKSPHDWQVDIEEVLYLGLNSVIIAGTGLVTPKMRAREECSDIFVHSGAIVTSETGPLTIRI